MYDRCTLDELARREVDDIGPDIRAVGYELRSQEMRPSLWVYELGEAMNRHRQREQEELYLVLSGRLEMTVGEDAFEVSEGGVVVVTPEEWGQLTAIEPSEVFVVGAPNVTDDGVQEDEPVA